ncbi:phosphate ABC transporter ATP-binding protein [Desulfofalx alkaliphila]|uniref:phosphate ABC transporter ATP-binding protein n=1 Tax=Desulfofalx alkaliphila TaxID=105483 RepID=UPI0004E11A89|nr:phosphate ABC transporter ATP-binding protein [Desulfofalx alkaliphila]
MSVSVRDLSVFFGKEQILKDISLEFKKNKITAIVGPSGCGKSTLLKTINRTGELERGFNHRGKVLLNGEDVYLNRDTAIIRRKIGLVFQSPVALPLSIKENVVFGAKYFGEKNRKELEQLSRRCLKQAGLWEEVKDKLHSPAEELSGGQKQRLSIARVLAVEPEVLLLDEPCSNLDPASTMIIEKLLVELSNQLTIILVTHNLFQAKRVAHETVLMMDGRVVEKGATEDFFANPQKQQTKDFVAGLSY